MRLLVPMIAFAMLAPPLEAAENWFLPYTADEHTVALLHFDGATPTEESDACGKAPAFKLTGGAVRGSGQFGGGILFDRVKASLNAPAHDAFRLRNDQDFTIEMWVRPDDAEGGMIFSMGTRFYLKIEPGKRVGAFGYRAASFPIRSYPLADLPVVRGQWQHIALTHGRDRTVKLYVNGILASTLSHSAEGDYAKGGSVHIGSHDGWTGYFKGAIDEVRISDCVREYRPIFTERYYLKGEKVGVLIDAARIPAEVDRITVRVFGTSGNQEKKPLLERVLDRRSMAGDLFPADELPLGESRVEVSFVRGSGEIISRVRTVLGFAGNLLDDLRKRFTVIERVCDSAQGRLAPERIESARLLVKSARDHMELRDFRTAESRTLAAERIAAALKGSEAAYRAAVRRAVRSRPTLRDVRITMSWHGDGGAGEALPWARRLGANELVASHGDATPEGIGLWKKAGYRTVLLGSLPIHDGKWIKEHPEHAQFGYWVSSAAQAKSAAAEIPIVPPSWGGFLRLSLHHAPKTHWKVADAADGKIVPPGDWEYDEVTRRVRLSSAVPGHAYKVYFMVVAGGMGDPLLPAFAEHGLAALREELTAYKGVLDTYWFDDLSFAYPGPTPQGPWDWESYTFAARPETQQRFTHETGIAFDPEWLVMAPRTIDVVPDPRYLAWMSWVQKSLKPWFRQAADVCRKYGVSSWLYWGDCHVGMEPYRGSLDGSIQEIDKPTADPVTARALVDFPGDVKRRLRVEWLFPKVAASDASSDRLLTQWANARRGLLTKPPSGIYWMPFPDVAAGRDGSVREDIVETIAEINDEFRLMGDYLAGAEAFKHDLNVYVLHSWGSVYSWRPWGSPILAHLTDLPVRVHFISFAEVEEKGIPADAHALFIYGLPNTAWSGGRWWQSGKVAQAVRGFVEKGGGILALQAPSHLESPKPHWALGALLGVRGEGTTDYQASQTDLSQLADTGVRVDERTATGSMLQVLKSASGHWLTEGATNISGVQETVRVASLPGARVLYALRSREGALPGVVISEQGRGRVAYLCGWSPEYAFSRLVSRALFWVAHKENDLKRLDASGGDDLFLYGYPAERLVALASNSVNPAMATLYCDPAIFGMKGKLRLTDVTANEKLWEGNAEALAAGVTIQTIPRCLRLLRLEQVPER